MDWNAPAGENTWNDGFIDAEGQSHENDEFFFVRHVGLWTQNQAATSVPSFASLESGLFEGVSFQLDK